MNNAWKGLVVGALTGMTGGVALDLAAATRRKAAAVLDEAHDRAPLVAKTVSEKARGIAHEVPAAVDHAARHVGAGVKKRVRTAHRPAPEAETGQRTASPRRA